MTKDQLIERLDRCYPTIIANLEEESRLDSYQQAAMHLCEAYERYDPADDDEFTLLLHKCAALLHKRTLSHRWNKLMRAGAVEVTIDDEHDEVARLYDTSPTNEAAEYIQLLPMVYRRVFTKVFIEGKDTEEAGAESDLCVDHINTMIRDGIDWIKWELEAL